MRVLITAPVALAGLLLLLPTGFSAPVSSISPAINERQPAHVGAGAGAGADIIARAATHSSSTINERQPKQGGGAGVEDGVSGDLESVPGLVS
ncbi:MAG: hypothetical protein M1835_003870, partial [Candelina submexicana]